MSSIDDLSQELRDLLVHELGLNVAPETLLMDQPLLDASRSGAALAIDSLDMLSLVLAIQDRYGVEFPEDLAELSRIFSSIRTVAENVARLQRPAAQEA